MSRIPPILEVLTWTKPRYSLSQSREVPEDQHGDDDHHQEEQEQEHQHRRIAA